MATQAGVGGWQLPDAEDGVMSRRDQKLGQVVVNQELHVDQELHSGSWSRGWKLVGAAAYSSA